METKQGGQERVQVTATIHELMCFVLLALIFSLVVLFFNMKMNEWTYVGVGRRTDPFVFVCVAGLARACLLAS